MNCPPIEFYDKYNPEDIERLFPGSMENKTSNGSISFKIS
jgi:hypothetical protein